MSEVVVRRRRRWPWVVLVLALALAGFVVIRHSGGAKHAAPAPTTVGVAKATSGPMPETLNELGTVTPLATVTVLPQLSGYLTEVAFTEGETVTAGQFLAQIDPRPYQIQLKQDRAQLAKDEAALAQARSDLARFETLARQDSISAQQVADQQFLVAQDQAATQVDQSNIDTALLNLAYCHITHAGRRARRPAAGGPGQLRDLRQQHGHRGDHHDLAGDGDFQRAAERAVGGADAARRRRATAGDGVFQR